MQILELNRIREGKVIKKIKLHNPQNYIIGRNDKHADIVINSDTISRKHCQIMVTQTGSPSIMDLDSANGTFVDDKQIKKNQIIILKAQQKIRLGECQDWLEVNLKKTSRSRSPQRPEHQQIDLKKQQISNNHKPNKLTWGNQKIKHEPWKGLNLDSNDKLKFMKLMGVKDVEKQESSLDKNLEVKGEILQGNLEKQFIQSIQRKDGNKRGLGFS